jgi:hypothetical protein
MAGRMLLVLELGVCETTKPAQSFKIRSDLCANKRIFARCLPASRDTSTTSAQSRIDYFVAEPLVPF